MTRAVIVWTLVALSVLLVWWDSARHESLRVCVIEEAHAWIDGECCYQLAGRPAMGASRCE